MIPTRRLLLCNLQTAIMASVVKFRRGSPIFSEFFIKSCLFFSLVCLRLPFHYFSCLFCFLFSPSAVNQPCTDLVFIACFLQLLAVGFLVLGVIRGRSSSMVNHLVCAYVHITVIFFFRRFLYTEDWNRLDFPASNTRSILRPHCGARVGTTDAGNI